eukprot:jgi/Mesvir1/24317/Mv11003-RA.1
MAGLATPSMFLVSLVMSVTFMGTMAFVWGILRRLTFFEKVFFPRECLAEQSTEVLKRENIFEWIYRVDRITDRMLKNRSGFDGVIIIRIFSFLFNFFLGAMVICFMPLMPCYYWGGELTPDCVIVNGTCVPPPPPVACPSLMSPSPSPGFITPPSSPSAPISPTPLAPSPPSPPPFPPPPSAPSSPSPPPGAKAAAQLAAAQSDPSSPSGAPPPPLPPPPDAFTFTLDNATDANILNSTALGGGGTGGEDSTSTSGGTGTHAALDITDGSGSGSSSDMNGTGTGAATCNNSTTASNNSTEDKETAMLTVLDWFSLANIPNKDNRLWVPYVCMVLLTLWCLYLIKVYYLKFVDLRTRYFQSPETGPGPYTVFVSDTPKLPIGSSPQEHISLYFKRLYPLQFYECQSVRDYNRLERWTKTLRESEMNLQHYEAELAWRDTRLVSHDFRRPTTRLGPWGLWGKKVDAVDWYSKAVKDGRVVVSNLRLKARNTFTSSAFVTFRSRATASIAAQIAHNANELVWRTEPAPEPRDVCWENCKYRHTERVYRQRLSKVSMVALMTVLMVPIGFIMGLTNFRTFVDVIKFLRIKETPLRKGFFSGIIPAVLLLSVTRTLLPRVTLWLSHKEGHISWSGIEHRAMMMSFVFYNINIVLGALTFTTLFSSLKDLIKHGFSSVDEVAKAVPVTGTFFIIYLIVNTFIILPIELVRPATAVTYFFRVKFVCRTAVDFRNAWRVGTPPLVREVAPQLLFILVGMLYSIVKPVIIPFLIVHFYATRLVWKNQLCHVYRRQWDSGGMLWMTFHRAVMWSLLTTHVVMIILFTLQSERSGANTWRFLSFPAQVYATLPVMAFTILWAVRLRSKWARTLNTFPLDVAMGMDGMDRRGGLDAPEPTWLREAFVPHFMTSQLKGPGSAGQCTGTGGAGSTDPYYGDDCALSPIAAMHKKKDAVFRGEVAFWWSHKGIGKKRRGKNPGDSSKNGGVASTPSSSVNDAHLASSGRGADGTAGEDAMESGRGDGKGKRKGSRNRSKEGDPLGADASGHGGGDVDMPTPTRWNLARRSVRFVGTLAGNTNAAVRHILPHGHHPRMGGAAGKHVSPKMSPLGGAGGEGAGIGKPAIRSPRSALAGHGGVVKRRGRPVRLLRGAGKGHRDGSSRVDDIGASSGGAGSRMAVAPGDVSVDMVSMGDLSDEDVGTPQGRTGLGVRHSLNTPNGQITPNGLMTPNGLTTSGLTPNGVDTPDSVDMSGRFDSFAASPSPVRGPRGMARLFLAAAGFGHKSLGSKDAAGFESKNPPRFGDRQGASEGGGDEEEAGRAGHGGQVGQAGRWGNVDNRDDGLHGALGLANGFVPQQGPVYDPSACPAAPHSDGENRNNSYATRLEPSFELMGKEASVAASDARKGPAGEATAHGPYASTNAGHGSGYSASYDGSSYYGADGGDTTMAPRSPAVLPARRTTAVTTKGTAVTQAARTAVPAAAATSKRSWWPWAHTPKNPAGCSHHEQTVLSLVLSPSFDAGKEARDATDNVGDGGGNNSSKRRNGGGRGRGGDSDATFTFDTSARPDKFESTGAGLGGNAYYSPAYDYAAHGLSAAQGGAARGGSGSGGSGGNVGGFVVGGGWQNGVGGGRTNASVGNGGGSGNGKLLSGNSSGNILGGGHVTGGGGSGNISGGYSSAAGHGGMDNYAGGGSGHGGGNASGVVMHPAVRWQQQVQEASTRQRSSMRGRVTPERDVELGQGRSRA